MGLTRLSKIDTASKFDSRMYQPNDLAMQWTQMLYVPRLWEYLAHCDL